MAELVAGFGRRDITPPLGIPNALGVTCFVEEIWDPLYTTALVLKHGNDQVVIVGTDLCAFLERPYQDIAQAVGKALGTAPDHVVINTSHTHSAAYISTELQDLLTPFGLKAVDLNYAQFVKQEIVAAAQEAANRMQPVGLQFGRGLVERVASNRRVKLPNGKTIHRYGRPPEEMRALDEGLIDPEVIVVRVDSSEGKPLGALVNYACHPTAAGGDLHPWVSADFVGYGLRSIEKALGAVPCLFLQGTAGNIGTGKWINATPREDTEAMGKRFADGINQALSSLQPVKTDSLSIARLKVHLAFEPFPPLAEIRRRLEEAVKAKSSSLIAHADALVVARRVEQFQQAPVVGISLGELAIACLPAEVFVEFGLSIKQRSPFPYTIICAYNDNSLQYIPTASAYLEGEYEIHGGWRYVAPGDGEKLADGALQALAELKSKGAV